MIGRPPDGGGTAEKHSQAPKRRRRFRRFSAIELLVALILLIVIAPFFQDQRGGDVVEAILFTIVLLSAVPAVGARSGTLLVTVSLASLAVVGKWINHFRPDLVPAFLFLPVAIGFVAFVIVNLLRFVARAKTVNTEVLCASICAYLMLGVLWSLAYMLAVRLSPGAFSFNVPEEARHPMNGSIAAYFSFVTLSTVGYGDITPVSHVARMLAMTEAMTGSLYVAVLIARLVSLYSVRSEKV